MASKLGKFQVLVVKHGVLIAFLPYKNEYANRHNREASSSLNFKNSITLLWELLILLSIVAISSTLGREMLHVGKFW
jgi:hypothetical protein